MNEIDVSNYNKTTKDVQMCLFYCFRRCKTHHLLIKRKFIFSVIIKCIITLIKIQQIRISYNTYILYLCLLLNSNKTIVE